MDASKHLTGYSVQRMQFQLKFVMELHMNQFVFESVSSVVLAIIQLRVRFLDI